MDASPNSRRKPVSIWVLVCLALFVLGAVLIIQSGGNPGPLREEPADASPMRQFIPDAGFPEDEKPPAEEDEGT
jgi:hypothetical protein